MTTGPRKSSRSKPPPQDGTGSLNPYSLETKGPLIHQGQYDGCWWPGKAYMIYIDYIWHTLFYWFTTNTRSFPYTIMCCFENATLVAPQSVDNTIAIVCTCIALKHLGLMSYKSVITALHKYSVFIKATLNNQLCFKTYWGLCKKKRPRYLIYVSNR